MGQEGGWEPQPQVAVEVMNDVQTYTTRTLQLGASTLPYSNTKHRFMSGGDHCRVATITQGASPNAAGVIGNAIRVLRAASPSPYTNTRALAAAEQKKVGPCARSRAGVLSDRADRCCCHADDASRTSHSTMVCIRSALHACM